MVLSAEQIVDRLVGRLADDVPQRHLYRAEDRSQLQAGVSKVVARAVHAVPDQLDVERIFTHHVHARHLIDETDLRLEITQPVRVGVARDPLPSPVIPHPSQSPGTADTCLPCMGAGSRSPLY